MDSIFTNDLLTNQLINISTHYSNQSEDSMMSADSDTSTVLCVRRNKTRSPVSLIMSPP